LKGRGEEKQVSTEAIRSGGVEKQQRLFFKRGRKKNRELGDR